MIVGVCSARLPDMKIEEYGFGRIVIDGKEYAEDVIITPGGVKPNWWRQEGHDVKLFDLADVLDPKPRLIIIGTGASGMCRVSDEVRSYCNSQEVELVELPTPEAVVEYNELDDKAGVLVALHLTC